MASTTINVNKRPIINSITTSPNSGYAWRDIFNFTVIVTDAESDFPITTIWYYYGSDMQRIVMAAADRTVSYMGKVPMGSLDIGLPYRALLMLSVDVYDSSGLLQTTPFAIMTRIEYLTLNHISNTITTANTSNITQIIDVSTTVDNLKTQDRDHMKYSTNPCLVNCNGNGICQSKKCICNSGFVLSDCSMTEGQFLQNLVVKGEIIKYLQEVCTEDNLVTNQTIFYCFQIMDSITSNIYLSPEDIASPVMFLAMQILDWIQNLSLDQTTLDQIGAVINNLLDYPATDCNKDDPFGFTVLQNIKFFMDHLHLLLVRNAFIDQTMVYSFMPHFALYSQRLSTSQIPGLTITHSTFSGTDPYMVFPSFGFVFSQTVADIQYILWDMDIFKCKSTQPKGVTMVLKKDLSIEDLDYSLTSAYEILYPEVPSSFSCPGSCVRQSAYNPTICGCLDKMTLMINSFVLRNTPQSNVELPETYDNSGAVVLNAVLGSICLVHMIAGVFLDIYKKKDLLIDLNRLTSFGQFFAYIFVTHSFISTIIKYDAETPRALRAFIYYLRLLGFEVLGLFFIYQDRNYAPLVLFFLKICTIFIVSFYAKVIYDLLVNNDILIGSRGDFRVKKRPADTSVAAVSRSLGMVMILAIFSCSVAGIVLVLNENTDESYPFFNNSFTIFYNCLLIDFFAFQVLKVLIQMWILNGTTSRIMRRKRMRSLTRSLVERYLLRYYSIFWIKERKTLQAVMAQ